MVKTTAEYAAHPSVAGLTGAAKKAAIKALYDADKAATPAAPRAKLPTSRELDKMVREYQQAFHSIKMVRETEKAVAVEVIVDFCDIERDTTQLVWLPKSQLVNGQAPGWLLNAKIDEVTEQASGRNRGSVFARYL